MATIKDVAREAGVSVSTASRALGEIGYVSEENKKKVKKAAAMLGYTPDLTAKSLRRGKSNVIGVIVSDIGNYFYNTVICKLEKQLKQMGYVMLLAYSNEDPKEEAQNLNLMLYSRVDGIIFTPVCSSNNTIVKNIQNHNIPLLQLYRNAYPELDSVVVDDETGAYLATQNLIKNGHRKIMLLGVSSKISPNRTNGYLKAYSEANLKPDKNLILECPLNVSIKDTVKKQIKQSKPTAIIAGTNTFGYDTFVACKEENLLIPKDISLVVFDDVPWVSLCDITAICQPIDAIASASVQTLMSKIGSRGDLNTGTSNQISTNIKIDPSLINRKSVKAHTQN